MAIVTTPDFCTSCCWVCVRRGGDVHVSDSDPATLGRKIGCPAPATYGAQILLLHASCRGHDAETHLEMRREIDMRRPPLKTTVAFAPRNQSEAIRRADGRIGQTVPSVVPYGTLCDRAVIGPFAGSAS